MSDDTLFAEVLDRRTGRTPTRSTSACAAGRLTQRDGAYVVSTHAAIRSLLFDPRLSSEDLPPSTRPRTGNPLKDWILNPLKNRVANAHRPLIFRDPPAHDTLRAS